MRGNKTRELRGELIIVPGVETEKGSLKYCGKARVGSSGSAGDTPKPMLTLFTRLPQS